MTSATEVRQPPPPPPAAPASDPVWLDRLRRVAHWCYRAMCRPRVRLVVIGLLLVALGALFVTNSVWTLPMLILGGLMLIVAWVGARLDGRFVVEWGEEGTGLEFRARIKATDAAALPAAAEDAEPERVQTVESTADTIDIDLDELKALVAAADRKAATERDLAKAAEAKQAA